MTTASGLDASHDDSRPLREGPRTTTGGGVEATESKASQRAQRQAPSASLAGSENLGDIDVSIDRLAEDDVSDESHD